MPTKKTDETPVDATPDETPVVAVEAPEIDEWLAENYRELAAQRGVSVAELAREHDEHSPRLAAWMRSQGAASTSQEPQNRHAPEKSEA